MATELLGVAGWTLENKTFFEKQLLSRATRAPAYMGWGLQKTLPQRGSNNLEWRRLERPTATTTALVEGTPPANTNTTWTNVVATVSQYGAYSTLSDVNLRQAIDNGMTEMVSMYGEHMRESIETVIRNVLVAGTNVQYAGGATSRGALTTGNVLSESEIRTALRNLKRRDARPVAKAGNKFVLITHPDAWYADILGNTTIQNAMQYAAVRGDQNPFFSGETFDYLGVKIVLTTNVSVVSGGGLSLANAVHVFRSVMLGDEAYGEVKYSEDTMDIIVKPVGSAGAADPLNQYGTIGWKAAIGVAILNQNFIQRIEHATSVNALPV
jgi:N4-gp56 family major capsid protein